MSSFLDFEVVYPKKGAEVIFDRRKFRKQRTGREKVLTDILEAFERLGKKNMARDAIDLLSIPNIYQLNKDLLCIVHEYYYSKEGDNKFLEILSNFENDFRDIVRGVKEKGTFKKLKDERSEYLFRQDFCCYLLIMHEFNEKLEPGTEYYYDEEYDASEDEFLDAEMDEDVEIQGD